MITKFPKNRTPSTVVGLALDGNRLDAALVRRSNGSLRTLKTLSTTLALNPLNSDPALMGRELRKALDEAGIKERNCVVCIPLSWTLSVQTKIPNIAEADLPGLIEIEAERGFPYAPETLSISSSISNATGQEERLATLAAVPRNHLLQLEKALRAAQLKPLSFTLGISSLQSMERDSLALAIGENSIDLQINANRGVATLRSLDSAIEVEGSQKSVDAEALAREIRVTLGQLPMESRGAVRHAVLFGQSDLAQKLAHDLGPLLQQFRMTVDWRRVYPADAFKSQFPPNTSVAPHLSAAALLLTGQSPVFEFLPPKVGAWQQMTARVSSKKLGWAGVAAAAVILLVGGAIGAQQWKLSRLRSQWAAMEKHVKEVDDLQAKIRRFRPWFDESMPSMSILRRLAESYPVEGTVWTKTVEIANQTSVVCSGTARNEEAFTKALDQLRAAEDVSNVSVDSVRGSAPLQYTFNFQFNPGGRNEN